MDAGSRNSAEDRYDAVNEALDALAPVTEFLEHAQDLTDDAHSALNRENEPLARDAKTVKYATDDLLLAVERLKADLNTRLGELEF